MRIISGRIPAGNFLKTDIVTGNDCRGFSRAIVGNANKHDFPFLKVCSVSGVMVVELVQMFNGSDWSIFIGGKFKI